MFNFSLIFLVLYLTGLLMSISCQNTKLFLMPSTDNLWRAFIMQKRKCCNGEMDCRNKCSYRHNHLLAVDGLGMAVTVLNGFMAIDYFTGIMGGIVNRNLNSRVGFDGIIRKIYYLMLVSSVYLLALVIPGIEYAGDGAATAFCVLEFISITENGTKMGLPTPSFIKIFYQL